MYTLKRKQVRVQILFLNHNYGSPCQSPIPPPKTYGMSMTRGRLFILGNQFQILVGLLPSPPRHSAGRNPSLRSGRAPSSPQTFIPVHTADHRLFLLMHVGMQHNAVQNPMFTQASGVHCVPMLLCLHRGQTALLEATPVTPDYVAVCVLQGEAVAECPGWLQKSGRNPLIFLVYIYCGLVCFASRAGIQGLQGR